MAWQHEGSRHDRGYDWQWVKLRGHVLRRDYHLCQPCHRSGRTTEATQVDHIIPKAQDGTDDMDNLQSICEPCHKIKTAEEKSNRPTFDDSGWPIW